MSAFALEEETLLSQYREAKDIEIERLLSQYGTSLSDMRELYPQLTETIKQRQLTTAFPDMPLFFTPSEAQQMGLSLQEGWLLKMTPAGEGYTSSLITPEKWEITEDDLYIAPSGEKYTKSELETALGVGYIPSVEETWMPSLEIEQIFGRVFPEQSVEEILAYAQSQPEAFVQDIIEIGRTPETEALLRAMYEGVTEEVLGQIFGAEALKLLFIEALKPVTAKNVDTMLAYFSANPDALRASLLGEGRNEKTDELVHLLYPGITEAQLADYFNPLSLIVEEELAVGGRGKWGTFTAGVGDLVANVGGIFKWLGHGGIGEKIAKFGQYMQAKAEPVPFEPGEFSWRQLFNPQFYATYGLRMLPTLMVLVVAGITGFAAVGAVVGPVVTGVVAKGIIGLKLGRVLQTILQGIGGAALMRPLESALEAGGTYDQARYQGLSHEEADAAADEVFNKNMRLVGLDAAQLAVAFMPTGSIGTSAIGAVRRGLVRIARVGGKLVFEGLTEGGEEVYQEMIINQALGREVDLTDPEMQLVFALGSIAGLGFGAGGEIITRITDRSVLGLTPEQKVLFDKNIKQGLTTIEALDVVIDQYPEVAGLVKKATEDVQGEVYREQLTEENRARLDEEQAKQKMTQIQESNPDLVVPGGDMGLGVKAPSIPLVNIPEPLLTIPTSQELIDGLIIPNWIRTTVKALARIPVIKKVEEAVLGWRVLIGKESQLTEDIVGRGAVVYGAITRIGGNAAKVMTSVLRNTIENSVKFFGFNEVGYSAKMAGKLLAQYESERENAGTLEHVFTHPEMYDWTGMDKGLQYVTLINRINKAIFALLQKEGVALNTVNERWIHRVVTGKTVEGEVVEVRGKPGVTGRKPGAVPSYKKPRSFRTMAEGIQAGIEYEPNIEASIGSYIEEAFKEIAGERFSKFVEEFGITPTERLLERFPEIAKRAELTKTELADAAKLQSAINRAKRGERLPTQTLSAIERRFPELGARLRALIEIPASAENQLRQLLSQNEKLIRSLKAELAKAKEAREVPKVEPLIVPDEVKLREAFNLMDYEDRLSWRNTMATQLQEIGEMVAEQESELEGVEEFLRTDPVASYKAEITITTRKGLKQTKKVALTDVLKEGQMPETLTKRNAQILLMGRELKPGAFDKEGNVRWEYIIDELADHFGMSEQELVNKIEQIADLKERARDLRLLVDDASRRAEQIKRMLGILQDVEGRPEVAEREIIPPEISEREARYEFLQLSEAEYEEAIKSGRYPEPARYEELTKYYAEPHEPGWKGLSLAEMFPTRYKDLLSRGVPDRLSASEVQQAIEEKRVPYERGVEGVTPEVTLKIIPQERWDSAKLGVKVDLVKAGGWVNNKGQLTKVGERIAESKWEDLSPAAQNVLQRLIYDRYGVAIPTAEAGMPEAGLQLDIFGYTTPVTPKGKGEIVQISMDDYKKLVETYEEQGLPMPYVNVKPKIEGVSELSGETEFQQVKFTVPDAMTAAERKAAFDTLTKEAKALVEARKAPYWQARAERAAKMEIVRQAGIGEGYLPMPFAGGRIFNQDFIDACNKFFGIEKGSSALKFTSDAAGILRITKAALDFSAMMIQGLPSFGLAHAMLLRSPRIGIKLMGGWYKALGESTVAFFNPGVFYGYMEKNQDAVLQRVSFLGSSRAVDYFEALRGKHGLGKIAAWTLGKIPLDPFARAEMAFYSAGEIVRNEFWKALSDKAIKQGKGFELARHLDLMTGLAQAEGVPLTVRQLESSFMWFAPNYTRACLSLLADVFRGGYTGAKAKQALGGLMVAGVVYYVGIQMAMALLSGKDEDDAWEAVKEGLGIREDPITHEVIWRPLSDFLGIKIGNYTFGPGGFWYGFVRLIGNISECINTVGDKERIDLVQILKHGGLNKDNPFVYWWYSRSSPVTGMGFDLATGKDFLGYPIETPWEYARYIMTRFEPIWMEQGINWMIPGLTRDYEIPEGVARAAVPIFEIFGWRSIPESSWVRFYDKAEDYIKQIPRDELDDLQIEAWEAGKLGWGELTKKQRQDLLTRYPELAELYEDAQNDSKIRQTPEWKAYTDRIDEERAIYYERIDELTRRLQAGEIDTTTYRELCSEAGQNYGSIIEAISRDPTYRSIFEYFDKKEAEGSKYEFKWDLAYAEYNSQIRFAEDAGMYLANGDYNWNERDRRIAAFVEKHGEELYNEILNYIATTKEEKGLNPLWVKKGQDSEKLSREYWNLPYKPIIEMTQEDFDQGNIPAEYYNLWKTYQGMAEADKEGFIALNPNLAKDWRAEYRLANPEADAMLALWGYGGKLQSMEAYNLVVKWGQELGIPLEQMGLGLPPQNLIQDYFGYNQLGFSGNSAESKLWRLQHPEFTNWAMENWNWEGTEDYRGIEYYQLQIKWRDAQAEYDAFGDRKSPQYIAGDDAREKAREQYLTSHPDFRDDRNRMKAMDVDFPKHLIEDWVEWYAESRSGYEDDWFLMEHKEFYDTMYKLGIWTEQKDFSKVPTREVYKLYQEYSGLPEGQARLNFRHEHPELDAWMLLAGKVTKLVGDRWTTTDPNLANRKYWLDMASHYTDLLKNLGIREDITAEELTDYQAQRIEDAIRELRGF